MEIALRGFLEDVCRTDNVEVHHPRYIARSGNRLSRQVPFYPAEGPTSILQFLCGTLEANVHRPESFPGWILNRRFSQSLLSQASTEGMGFARLMITHLKVISTHT